MTPRPGLLRGSKIKNYKGANALRVTWSPPPEFSSQTNPKDARQQQQQEKPQKKTGKGMKM